MTAEQIIFHPPGGRRLFIIVGAFGSGKTEFAINLALALTKQGRQTAMADLDLVNLYFRSREKDGMLESRGVKLIAPEGELRHADLPSIPSGLWQLVYDKNLSGVLDIGGDRTGARVLGAYAADIKKQAPAVWYVFNQARYDNAQAGNALASLRQIETSAGMEVNGIVHNTHLLGETTAETVLQGAQAAGSFAAQAGLPLICHCIQQDLMNDIMGLAPLFPMEMYMNRPWEDG